MAYVCCQAEMTAWRKESQQNCCLETHGQEMDRGQISHTLQLMTLSFAFCSELPLGLRFG